MERHTSTSLGGCWAGPPSHLLALNLLPQGQPSILPAREFVADPRIQAPQRSCILQEHPPKQTRCAGMQLP